MKLYVAGAMSGLPDHGYPAFHAAAAQLRAVGYDVVNPAELDGETPWDDSRDRWGECIVRDLEALNTCDGLCLLDGWEFSDGAAVEHTFAQGKGLPILRLKNWLNPWIINQYVGEGE